MRRQRSSRDAAILARNESDTEAGSGGDGDAGGDGAGRPKRSRWDVSVPLEDPGTAKELSLRLLEAYRTDVHQLASRILPLRVRRGAWFEEFRAFAKRYITMRTVKASRAHSGKGIAGAMAEAAERGTTVSALASDTQAGDSAAASHTPSRTRLGRDVCQELDNLCRLYQTFKQRQQDRELDDIEQARMELPIAEFRHEIISTIRRSQVTVVAGATGCGKSTQVPRFLLDAGWSRISCTQPRRISATALAKRVAVETGDEGTSDIGWQIRFHSSVSSSTKLVFMTEGILLRHLGSDPQLHRFDAIVLDEVHERHISTDFLLGVLRGILPLRPELRVVLMSATINPEAFSKYFGGAPIITVPGRTYPVEVEYCPDRVEHDRLNAAWNRAGAGRQADGAIAAHRSEKSDSGGAMARNDRDGGSKETRALRRLAIEEGLPADHYSKAGGGGHAAASSVPHSAAGIAGQGLLQQRMSVMTQPITGAQRLNPAPFGRIIDSLGEGDNVLVFVSGVAEINMLAGYLESMLAGKMWIVLPLHAGLGVEEQDRVFTKPPPGHRKCIIATNVAETSITIDDIKVVIDSGKERCMAFDPVTNTQRLQEFWVSRASAAQRSGRAGRTGPGRCFRMYSRKAFDAMADFSPPEITRMPLESVVLKIKSLNLNGGNALAFAFLDPPALSMIVAAEEGLRDLGALRSRTRGGDVDAVALTQLGQILADLPVEGRVGKILVFGAVLGLSEVTMVLAAAMTVRSPFRQTVRFRAPADDGAASSAPPFVSPFGDAFTLLNCYDQWSAIRSRQNSRSAARDFCDRHGIIEQRLFEVGRVAEQFRKVLGEAGLVAKLRRSKGMGSRPSDSTPRLSTLDTYVQNERPQKVSREESDFDSHVHPSAVALAASRSLSVHDISILSFVLMMGMTPNYAVQIPVSKGTRSEEAQFRTRTGVTAYLHPGSALNATIGYGESSRNRMQAFLTLLETRRPYITGVLQVENALPHSLLLASRIDASKDFSRLLVDRWLLFELDKPQIGETIVGMAVTLAAAMHALLHVRLSDELAKLETTEFQTSVPVHKMPTVAQRIVITQRSVVEELDAGDSEVVATLRKRLSSFLLSTARYKMRTVGPGQVNALSEADSSAEPLQLSPVLQWGTLKATPAPDEAAPSAYDKDHEHWVCPRCKATMIANAWQRETHVVYCQRNKSGADGDVGQRSEPD